MRKSVREETAIPRQLLEILWHSPFLPFIRSNCCYLWTDSDVLPVVADREEAGYGMVGFFVKKMKDQL